MSTNENYSHTIAETIANLRPVIIGQHATPWDDIDCKAGYIVPLDNPLAVANRLDNLAMLNDEAFRALVESVKQYYKTSPMINAAVSGHMQMFNSICETTKSDFKNV